MEKMELGNVAGHGQYRQVEIRRVVNAPIEKVWSAITNADEVRHWWAGGSIEAREGGRIRLGGDADESDDCGNEAPGLDGRIKVFVPPHLLSSLGMRPIPTPAW